MLREPVFHLHVDTFLRAVVELVLRAEIPEIRRRRRGVLVIILERGRSVDVLAVEQIHRDPQIARAAESIEDLLIGKIREWVDRVIPALLDVLVERRRPAQAKAVTKAAPLLHVQRRAGLEVHRATERISGLVGQLAFDHLQLLEHRTGEAVRLELAVEAADVGHELAVHIHAVHRRRLPPDDEAGDVTFIIELRSDAREAHGELTGGHIGQIAVGIERDDVLHVVGIALRRERERVALALSGHAKLPELVNLCGQVEVSHQPLAGRDIQGLPLGVQSEVGDDQLHFARGHSAEHEAAGVVGEHRAPEPRRLNLHPLEQIARRRIADRATDRSALGGAGHRPQPKGRQDRVQEDRQ